MTGPRSLRRCDSGATAVELALVMPMFIALVFGIFNYGWGLYCGGEVRNAIQDASRMLIVDPHTSVGDIRAAVAARLHSASMADVTLTMTTESLSGSDRVARLSWVYAYTIDTPFISRTLLRFDSSIITPLRAV